MPIKQPTISIIIPAFNEANYIDHLVRHFLQTSYTNLIEILIADGGSTDGTQDIIKQLSAENSRVRLLNNPRKIQAVGLNIMLKECQGDIVLRADAHSDYAPDYIEKCVEALLKSGASNAGGAQRVVAKSAFQSGVALASRSFLGNGGAKYRDPNYQGYADTVYLGCFWKECILAVGGSYIEEATNEDAELNQRLISRNEHAIYIDPNIKSWYYPRENLYSLFIQYFKYGMGRCNTSKKHPLKAQLRGLLPSLVISTVFVLLIIDLMFPALGLPIKLVFCVGLLLPFLESLRVTLKLNRNFGTEIWRGNPTEHPSLFSRWIFCGLTLLTIPFAHFAGYIYQLGLNARGQGNLQDRGI
jgi:succinoglycan biosynthesis protein ExoA